MSTDIKRNDTGIFTVEGNLAGSRAARMAGLREKQKADFELRRKQIQEENERASLHDIDSKFVAQTTTYEDQFKVGEAPPCMATLLDAHGARMLSAVAGAAC